MPDRDHLSAKEQRLEALKHESSELERKIGTERYHFMDIAVHVSTLAFQFGQIGEIWESFVPMDLLKSIGTEAGKRFYPPLIKDALGKKLKEELQKEGENGFSIDTLKRIAAIGSLMGDMDKKRTAEDML